MGKSEEMAAREAIEEVGDPKTLARAWRAEYREERFSPMVRNVAAVMLSVVGFFAAIGVSDFWKYQVSPEKVDWIPGWQSTIYSVLWQLCPENANVTMRETVASIIPLLVVGLLVGRVSRRRGWLLVLVPLLFWGLDSLSYARHGFAFRAHLIQGMVQAAALLLGAFLGQRTGRVSAWAGRVAFSVLFIAGFFGQRSRSGRAGRVAGGLLCRRGRRGDLGSDGVVATVHGKRRTARSLVAVYGSGGNLLTHVCSPPATSAEILARAGDPALACFAGTCRQDACAPRGDSREFPPYTCLLRRHLQAGSRLLRRADLRFRGATHRVAPTFMGLLANCRPCYNYASCEARWDDGGQIRYCCGGRVAEAVGLYV